MKSEDPQPEARAQLAARAARASRRASRAATAPRAHGVPQRASTSTRSSIDPRRGRTLGARLDALEGVAAGSTATGNVEAAKRSATAIAALAREKQIEEVVFNRNGFLYHGRVKALADAAREAGLQF